MRIIPAFLALSLALVAPAAAGSVNVEDVRAMAFDKGIVKIKEVELDDGIWEVEGTDASGHEIEMKVDAASGAILKLERDYRLALSPAPIASGRFAVGYRSINLFLPPWRPILSLSAQAGYGDKQPS